MNNETVRIPFETVRSHLENVLLKMKVPGAKAKQCADTITGSTCDGVLSHGLARFPHLVRQISDGQIDAAANPALVNSLPSTEHWDGNKGIGICNAYHASDRAITLAKNGGLALVTLVNTTHWLRAGTYGWYAADRDCALICWTNTIANMPAWNSSKALLGNNPLVIAVPSSDGNHMVLDMAMSQFSYGKLYSYSREGKALPVPGGFDSDGKTTCDPSAILASGLPMPAGYWKGSALSLVLDILASTLAGGKLSLQLNQHGNDLCQVFIALPMQKEQTARIAEHIKFLLTEFDKAENDGRKARYPGQHVPSLRTYNLEHGVPVPKPLWEKILSLPENS